MNPARWRQLESLYNQAMEMDETQRTSFLRESCGGDEDLKRELEELFAEESHVAGFMEKAALWEVAHEFAATAEAPWVGRQVGHYQFESLLGAGGMGEVYRARDTKLKRNVAIKILPSEFSVDRERNSRFQREAELLASLNHPNIAAIYNLEEDGDCSFLILELVEGETLAERLRRGPFPLHDALRIASQIAEGLEAAHERGIIHRDLKPANIKLTPDGKVKILDFGLAKAFAGEAAGVNLSNAPAEMSASMRGAILGTAAYMSPEQANGGLLDRRTDIFAFGAVLFEMLTGKRAFPGTTAVEVLAAVIRAEPDWRALPADAPVGIRRLLRRCLAKDRNRRLQTSGDARIEIEEAGMEPEPTDTGVTTTTLHRREVLAWIAAGAGAVAAGAFGSLYYRGAAKESERLQEITTPPGGRLSFTKISPDGKRVVYQAAGHLWLRVLDSLEAQQLPQTEEGASPFWSPDSRSIGFIKDKKLMRLDLGRGNPRELAATREYGMGGAWGGDTILFAPRNNGPIYRVASNGAGSPVEATRLNGHTSHRFPNFLPDGRHFLFYATAGDANIQGVYIGSLDNEAPWRLLESDSAAVFQEPGYLLFRRYDNLMAKRLDLRTFQTTGDSFFVAADVSGNEGADHEAAISTSNTGLIAYRSQQQIPSQLTWFNRDGLKLNTLGDVDSSVLDYRISPDEHYVAIARRIRGNPDLWLYETEGKNRRQITSDSAIDRNPVWSREGNRIAFSSRRSGIANVFLKVLDSGAEERGRESATSEIPDDWSPDGRFILFRSGGSYFAYSPEGGEALPVTASGNEADGRFSPDGNWVAYKSYKANALPHYQVEVIPFHGPGGPIPVSTKGGGYPHWCRNGREILYWGHRSLLTSVSVTTKPNGKLEFGPATQFGLKFSPGEEGFDVTSDGQRILINKVVGQPTTPPINIIHNWKPKP